MENRILQRIPPEERRGLEPHLRALPLPAHAVLAEMDRPLNQVVFPNRGVVSLLTIVESGQSIEAAVVGPEGALGTEAMFSRATLPLRAVVLLAGEGVTVAGGALRPALEGMPVLRSLLQEQLVELLRFTTQTIACNRFHLLPQRCARWLCMLGDRAPSPDLGVTQDLMGQMLGVHRPGISVALRILEQDAAISQQRGIITIRDRGRLARHACECYQRPADRG